jgi:FlaA1/EpsC-like NDP-sugar epimerase
MGEQIRVLEMARHLIRLSGFVPDEEIPITFTGLRPGEKLYEELVGADEAAKPSGEAKINRVCLQWQPNLEQLTTDLRELEWLAEQGRTKAIVALLREIVPTFRLPGENPTPHRQRQVAENILPSSSLPVAA